MPTLAVRQLAQVPSPRSTSTASLKQQRTYEGFLRDVGSANVGELHLDASENLRSVKVRLRRAAKRSGVEIEVWDIDGKVYFRNASRPARRPRSST